MIHIRRVWNSNRPVALSESLMLKMVWLSRAKFAADQHCDRQDCIPCEMRYFECSQDDCTFLVFCYVWLKPYLLFTTNVLILVLNVRASVRASVCVYRNLFHSYEIAFSLSLSYQWKETFISPHGWRLCIFSKLNPQTSLLWKGITYLSF